MKDADKLIRRVAEAIDHSRCAFLEQGFDPPTQVVIGEDVQEALLAYGCRPTFKGSWGHVCGVEVFGVSERIGQMVVSGRPIYTFPDYFRKGT